jgi:hypothetical protein
LPRGEVFADGIAIARQFLSTLVAFLDFSSNRWQRIALFAATYDHGPDFPLDIRML